MKQVGTSYRVAGVLVTSDHHGFVPIIVRGTFQKFFTQRELRDWIDTTLGVSSVAAGPGIFGIFRDEGLRQTYAAARYRRSMAVPTQRQSGWAL